ncbi:MAG: succinate dehydrogenase assembly factor 2 [Spongiibacteraceae bacterium]|nr:succinate dehydrogenase assembly factor 2 [Spongiibacteraceae bacterium]
MISDNEYKRIYWASRRGMLELDLILIPFVENQLQQLSEADQQAYIVLLEEEDTDLFSWFISRKKPENSQLAGIVGQIIAYRQMAAKP